MHKATAHPDPAAAMLALPHVALRFSRQPRRARYAFFCMMVLWRGG
ncbi:hypothetical protein [Niveibacterium sp.]